MKAPTTSLTLTKTDALASDRRMAARKTGDKQAEAAAERRRAKRMHWPIARFRLGEEPIDDLSTTRTPVECVAMMWTLAQSAWRVAGRPLPTYDRRHMPGRFFRPGTPRPDPDDA